VTLEEAPLLDELRRMIRADGPMPVARYMDLCLSHPDHGYYRKAEAIGVAGDFVTAPEISQIFGELLGIWVAATWQQLGAPERFRIMELGPGRGTMMRDVLRAMRVMPGLVEHADVVLVEISDTLREHQRRTLANETASIAWATSLDEVAGEDVNGASASIPTLILANEFFDALPVTQYIRSGGEWHERAVGLDQHGNLTFTRVPVANPPENAPSDVADGAVVESRRAALTGHPSAFSEALGTMAAQHPTVLLAIDYGYDGPAVGDTFQAMHNQAYANVLDAPAMQDLTAHVDFSELSNVLNEAGMTCDGPLTQSDFLAGLGFAARLETLRNGKVATEINRIETAALRLVADPGMGTLFRVLAARSAGIAPLIPFNHDA